MNTFSISQLAQFSGVKAHTIRVWEQRYNALRPGRSEGNTRYYDDGQLRRLLNIVSLSSYGYKVSALCVMEDEELFSLIKDMSAREAPPKHDYFITQLVAAGLDFDEVMFEKVFAHCLLRLSIKRTYKEIIYPLLFRVGLLWSADSIPPAAEHFISNLLRQKLFTAIDALPVAKENSKVWLCFLPEDEFHDIGLLFAAYMIRAAGGKVIYLGSNVPVSSLTGAVTKVNPAFLLTFLVRNNSLEDNYNLLVMLERRFTGKKIFVATGQDVFKGVKVPANVQQLKTVSDLDKILLTNSLYPV